MEPSLLVTEIFYSLQGETAFVGLPTLFIRLTGCNLRCRYCDTSYAFKGKRALRISEILAELAAWPCSDVLVTGGEPLMQRSTPLLIQALKEAGYFVSIETHGEASIADVVDHARIVLDIKTPGSGMSRGGFRQNLPLLKRTDSIKFVITSEEDYLFAKNIIPELPVNPDQILLSPALPAINQPEKCSFVTPRWLAEQILTDRLNVRFQLQLHKSIWGDKQGV